MIIVEITKKKVYIYPGKTLRLNAYIFGGAMFFWLNSVKKLNIIKTPNYL